MGSFMADNLLYDGDNLDILRRYLTDESGDQVDLDPPSRATRTITSTRS
jgi:hypothetical protein